MNDPFGKHYGDACYVAHTGKYISCQVHNIFEFEKEKDVFKSKLSLEFDILLASIKFYSMLTNNI